MFTIWSTSLQDIAGVCDCCDGQDEIGSPFGVQCPNLCDRDLHSLRVQTLAEYRRVYSGTCVNP